MSTPTPEYYRKQIPLSKEDLERGYVEVDPYRIARLWELNDPALFQAFKKVLCGGQRGGKDKQQDAKEARDAISRWLELEEEVSPEFQPMFWSYYDDPGPLRLKPNGKVEWLIKKQWVEQSYWPEYWKCIGYTPISEAEARALVEKAGGVW